MTKKFDILAILLVVLLSGMVAACSKDNDFDIENAEDSSAPTMGITIALDGTSRSGENGSFEVGEGLENYLDIINGNYRIYFFDTDNKFIASLKPFQRPTLINSGNNNNSFFYQFKGIVPNNLPLEFKLVVIFNWRNYPEEIDSPNDGAPSVSGFQLVKGVTTIEQLCSHASSEFDYIEADNDVWLDKTKNRLIPFYGVRQYDLNNYVGPGDIVDGKIKGSIYIDLSSTNNGDSSLLPLLRAMAKVEVILYDPNMDFESVELINVNPKGYCAPKNASTHDSYDHGYVYDKDFIRDVHLPWKDVNQKDINATTGIVKSLTMTRKSDNEKKWIAYIPEYLNQVNDESYSKIKVTLKKNSLATDKEWESVPEEKKSQYIYFSQNGQNSSLKYDIWRNNIYRFTVSSMNFNLECKVDIQPFASVSLNADYGLLRDERGDLMVETDADDKLPKWFVDYLADNPDKKPKVVTSVSPDGIEYHLTDTIEFRKGKDYYAIVMTTSGKIDDAEIWIKDRQGCRVLSNIVQLNDNDNNCNTRWVMQFFGTSTYDYYKDSEGFQRVHHYNNHSTISIGPDEVMYYKEYQNGVFSRHYLVESFYYDDKGTDDTSDDEPVCWIISHIDQETSVTTFNKIGVNGEILENTYKKIDADGNIVEDVENGVSQAVILFS